ncbi:MAG: helix-turn-helix domain-containing protein [Hominimerdicola sp.]
MLTIDNIFMEYNNLVTVDDLMQMLNIGKNKAYDLLKDGSIKSKRVGRKYMIPKIYVIDFLNH